MGNPLLYDTSVDEGIKLSLRCAAERSHPATIQQTVFECFMVMGVLNTNKHIYGSSHPTFIAQLDDELLVDEQDLEEWSDDSGPGGGPSGGGGGDGIQETDSDVGDGASSVRRPREVEEECRRGEHGG